MVKQLAVNHDVQRMLLGNAVAIYARAVWLHMAQYGCDLADAAKVLEEAFSRCGLDDRDEVRFWWSASIVRPLKVKRNYMALFFPRNAAPDAPTMVFVDGENLAIRYGALLKERQAAPASHITYEPDVFVWSIGLNNICVRQRVVRKHYYTCAQGDIERLISFMTDCARRISKRHTSSRRIEGRIEARRHSTCGRYAHSGKSQELSDRRPDSR